MTRPGLLRRPLTWGPWVFFALFGVVLAANAALVAFAFATWTGLETQNAYDKGLSYNRTLEAARRQSALGWRVDITLVPISAGRVRLEVAFRDRNGRPPPLRRVDARLVRPTHSGYDLVVPLDALGDGRYGAETMLPLPGQWDVRVRAERDGGVYQATRRMVAR